MIDLKYIVTGTGRCGTLYMANLLTTFGFPCTHEGIFTIEGAHRALEIVGGRLPAVSSKTSKKQNLSDYEMEIVAESSYMAAPYMLNLFDSAKVIHVVRNPFAVIKSFIKRLGYFRNRFPQEDPEDPHQIHFENFIYRHLPELHEEMSQTERACLYYVRWNKMIESSGKVKYFHRIEDDAEGLKKFFDFKGEKYYKEVCNIMPEKESAEDCQIRNINPWIKQELFDICKRYGYMKI